MTFQTRMVGGDSIQHPRDAMRNIIFYNVPDKQRREINAHYREQQIKPVISRHIKAGCQEILYFFNDMMEHITCDGGEKTDDKS